MPTIRRAEDGDADFALALRIDGTCFGATYAPEKAASIRPRLELDRATFALDGDEEVGFASSYTMELTVPGGRQVPVGGLTWVGVLPTHRRRGHMRALIVDQLQQTRERGEVASMLTASEGGIYGRLGYGVATRYAEWALDRRAAAIRADAPTGGRVRIVFDGPAAVAAECEQVFDRHRRATVGELSQARGFWRMWSEDAEWGRSGGSALRVVLHEDLDGTVDGFAAYRLARVEAPYDWHDLTLTQFVALTAAARADLWRFLLGVDLVRRIRYTATPDDVLSWLLENRRTAEGSELADWTWAHVLDVPRAFAGRTYRGSGAVVFAVAGDAGRSGGDDVRPATYRLDVSDGEAECRPADDEPELVMTREGLGALWLGGASAQDLRSAGPVVERSAGAAARWDALAASVPPPSCSVRF